MKFCIYDNKTRKTTTFDCGISGEILERVANNPYLTILKPVPLESVLEGMEIRKGRFIKL